MNARRINPPLSHEVIDMCRRLEASLDRLGLVDEHRMAVAMRRHLTSRLHVARTSTAQGHQARQLALFGPAVER